MNAIPSVFAFTSSFCCAGDVHRPSGQRTSPAWMQIFQSPIRRTLVVDSNANTIGSNIDPLDLDTATQTPLGENMQVTFFPFDNGDVYILFDEI